MGPSIELTRHDGRRITVDVRDILYIADCLSDVIVSAPKNTTYIGLRATYFYATETHAEVCRLISEAYRTAEQDLN